MESASLINILIRTSNRPELFARCRESIRSQTYRHRNIIIGYDNTQALKYIPAGTQTFPMVADFQYPFYYDRYCNKLAHAANIGWILFLDDDDFLHTPTVLEELSEHFTGDHGAIICQFLRNGMPKPNHSYIKKGVVRDGHIGLPSLILRAEHGDKLYLDGYKSGDYRAILKISQEIKTKFIELVVVETDRRSHGLMELSEKTENIK